jgi:hypothetical protein
MAKGIYSSGMSAWERNKAGLPADHCGPTTIDEKSVEAPVVEEVAEVVEVVVEAKAEEIPAEKAGKKSLKDKLTGK